MMRSSTFEALDTLDAAIFSGDEFEEDGDDFNELVNFLDRWNAEIEKRKIRFLSEQDIFS